MGSPKSKPSSPMASSKPPTPSSKSKSSSPVASPALHHQARRRRRRCLIATTAVLLALAVVLAVLFLTVLRVRDPTIRLVSTQFVGAAPRFALLPTPSIRLNLTLLITVSVHNPNPASFTYADGGHADLSYRGAHVGDAEIDPGAVPSGGDAEVRLVLTLEADRFAAAGDSRQLADDVESRALPLDASTTVPGTVLLFGVFRRSAVAFSECRLVFAVMEMRVQSHQCNSRTKL
ncbi:harpin-induced protein 1 containing expressed [Hordeum vulgare]|uniref:Late embryogenesis abundant protein LEA-2 subgroup domain-containing protein n=1 Tax=Hordeum vulgare subsp. vulgare TaxID=112509 RepID=A0A8I6XGY5_HORVV|nr:uncharacterized protein LOC123448094 [Hordeum vulgare subsp. vulgare]KAE8769101.1 harpin-induced protein 1 containing expressed [Hordeum vulgare]KAI4997326.1 hypothetical protein ZWY2020_052668 [Hordeum vulgare]